MPQPEERRVRYRHEESVTQPARKFLPHRRVVAEERVERSHYDDVEIVVDATIFHDGLQAHDIRLVFRIVYMFPKYLLRGVSLHHHKRRRRLVYLLSYKLPPLAGGDAIVPEHDPLWSDEAERGHHADDVVKTEDRSGSVIPRQMN